MKQVNFITDLVEIKDKNITFLKELTKIDDDFIYLFAILDYAPPVCPKCGGKCIRYGFQRPSKYPYFPILNQPTLIILKKRRFQCQSCQKVFVAKTSFVKSNHSIPQDLIFKIGLLLNKGRTMTSIADELHISPSMVCRDLQQYIPAFRQRFRSLPEVLSFDEFSIGKGQMGFVIYDPIKDHIIDILEGRRKQDLIDYFLTFSRQARDKVKFITTDMYEPYMEIVTKLFPKAKLILDRFHIIQNISREFLKVRIKIQNTYPRDSREYRHIKRFWKILQSDSQKLSQTTSYNKSFKRHLSSTDINAILKSYDERLDYFHELYQQLLFYFREKETSQLFDYLNDWLSRIKEWKQSKDLSTLQKEILNLSDGFQRVIKTTLKYEPYVRHALQYHYSNGPIEGLNNQIKTLKKIAYGFRNFTHFRVRIMLQKNIKTHSVRRKRHQINEVDFSYMLSD